MSTLVKITRDQQNNLQANIIFANLVTKLNLSVSIDAMFGTIHDDYKDQNSFLSCSSNIFSSIVFIIFFVSLPLSAIYTALQCLVASLVG